MSGETDVPGKSDEVRGPGERRAWVRYPCSLEVSCPLPAPPPANGCMARVRDISARGLGLVLNRKVQLGPRQVPRLASWRAYCCADVCDDDAGPRRLAAPGRCRRAAPVSPG